MRWSNSLLAAAAAVALIGGIGPPAHAGLLVQEQVNGGAIGTICSAPSGNPCVGTILDAGVSFVLTGADSNSPGTPALADLLSAAVRLSNTGTTAASIKLLVGDTGFANPVAPPGSLVFESAIGTTTLVAGAGNTLAYLSCLDAANGQNVCPGSINTAILHPAIAAVGSDNAATSLAVAALAAPYSMTEFLTINLDAGSTINYSASTRIEPVGVSEPGSLALLGGGLVAMWFGFRVNKRRQRRNSPALPFAIA